MQIVQEFEEPHNTTKEDINASGDGKIPAVLDLRPDDSLVEQGLAREVTNRVQKLRKRAGLVATDVVDVYVEIPADAGRPLMLATACWSAMLCVPVIDGMYMISCIC